MEKIIPLDIFVPSKEKEVYFVNQQTETDTPKTVYMDVKFLKDVYVLTKEQLTELLGNAFDAGMNNGFDQGADIDKFIEHLDKEEFINSII
jgi:hypothetical protein